MATSRTSSRTGSGVELLLAVDRTSPEPVHRQLGCSLRDAIRSGRLEGGASVPSSRALARQLGLSRGVVVEAYEQLVAEGYLVSRPGGATRVAEGLGVAGRARRDLEPGAPGLGLRPGRPRRHLAPELREFDFRPGGPDVAEFPRTTWVRALRRALESAPANRLGY